MKTRNLFLKLFCVLVILATVSCVMGRTNLMQSFRSTEEVFQAARRSAGEMGYIVTTIDFDRGFMVAELRFTTGFILPRTHIYRISVYVKRSYGNTEIEVVMTAPGHFSQFKKALKRRIPDLRVIMRR